MKATTVLIVDDHVLLRMGLKSLIGNCQELTCAGEAIDGRDGVRKASNLHPDVIVMDLIMPKLDGVEATRQILAENPAANILILTSFGEADSIAHALECGAKGAILKTDDSNEIINAIKTVARGGRILSPEIKRILSESPAIPNLSDRQREILHALTQGLSNADISIRLDISPETVKQHINNLFVKIGAANRAEAVAIALKKHLLKI